MTISTHAFLNLVSRSQLLSSSTTSLLSTTAVNWISKVYFFKWELFCLGLALFFIIATENRQQTIALKLEGKLFQKTQQAIILMMKLHITYEFSFNRQSGNILVLIRGKCDLVDKVDIDKSVDSFRWYVKTSTFHTIWSSTSSSAPTGLFQYSICDLKQKTNSTINFGKTVGGYAWAAVA